MQKECPVCSPSKKSSFVLEKDLCWIEKIPPFGLKQLSGLRHDKYNLVAENKDGYFYQGMGAGNVFTTIDGRIIDSYLKTGQLPTPETNPYFRNFTGGLWISKNDKRKSSFFYLMQTREYAFATGYLAAGAIGAVAGPLITGDKNGYSLYSS